MIGQVVTAASVYVLHVNGIAARTNVSRGSSAERGQAGARCYLVVGVVSEFGCGVVHLASDFFEGVCSGAGVLYVWGVTLRRCFCERSGSLCFNVGPLSSSVDLF